MIRKRVLLLFLILIILGSISLVAAENNSRDSNTGICPIQANLSVPFYITINPIGNHSVGETFFVNGTTNLPICYNLDLKIQPPYFNPGGYNSWFESRISIELGENGINYWSVNSSSPLWTTCNGPETSCSDRTPYTPYPGDYIATVNFTANSSISQSQVFIIYPNESVTSQYLQNSRKTSNSPPSTAKSPLSPILPLLAVAGIAIIHWAKRKRNM